jgi:hypothetical protein
MTTEVKNTPNKRSDRTEGQAARISMADDFTAYGVFLGGEFQGTLVT